MLVWESKRFDLEEIVVAEQAIEVEAEGVGGELGVEAGAEAGEAPTAVGVRGVTRWRDS